MRLGRARLSRQLGTTDCQLVVDHVCTRLTRPEVLRLAADLQSILASYAREDGRLLVGAEGDEEED